MGGTGADPYSTFKKGTFFICLCHSHNCDFYIIQIEEGPETILGAVYAHLVIQFLDKHNPDVKCHGDFIQKPEQRK